MSVRVYIEKNLTPELVEEALPLMRAAHLEVLGRPLAGVNTNFLGGAAKTGIVRLVLARDGDKMVGYAFGLQVETFTNERQLLLSQIYVDPEYRKKGRAPAVQMVQLFKAMADGAGAKLTAVGHGQENIDFYISMGGSPSEIMLDFV